MISPRVGLVLFATMIVSSTGCLTQPELDNDELGRVIYTIPVHPGDGPAHTKPAPAIPAQESPQGTNAPTAPENGAAPANQDAFPPNKPASEPKSAEPSKGEAAKGKSPTGDSATEKAAKEDAAKNSTKKPAP